MRKYIIAVAIIAVATVLLVLPNRGNVAQAGPRDSATVAFGQDTGSQSAGFPRGHDESDFSRDSLVPRNVVISEDGTVTFNIDGGIHQVGIYAPGTTPDMVDQSVAIGKGGPCAGNGPLYIDGSAGGSNDVNLVAIVGEPVCNGGDASVDYTFDSGPGRYLVICTFAPHLNGRAMYGWVDVK